ncbi:MAG: caspase family protein [Vicinamibacterales bacterium]
MLRAGLFIGVDRTGGLPRLKDAAAGAQRMHAWALSQGLVDGTQARLLTDANGGKVTSDQVYDAVQALIGGAGVEQLVVYFAGHGVNINRGEQWLLSDAPVRTSAAVDVSNSAKLARYSGVSHVVFLSDACRVAPDSIQAQNVRGIDIFPNDDASDRARPVDEFYACRLGRTAAEVRDAAAAAGAFRAVYTGALFEALAGQHAALLKPGDAGDPARYVWPVPLQDWLEAELPRRIRALSLSTPVIQDPDAVLSAEGQWLAQLAPSQIVPAPPPMPAASPGPSSRSRGTTRGVGSRPPASSGPRARTPAAPVAGRPPRLSRATWCRKRSTGTWTAWPACSTRLAAPPGARRRRDGGRGAHALGPITTRRGAASRCVARRWRGWCFPMNTSSAPACPAWRTSASGSTTARGRRSCSSRLATARWCPCSPASSRSSRCVRGSW